MGGQAPSGRLALQTIAMPADTNASGDIFGGWLMAQMDIAASIPARARSRGRVATVAVEAMSFHRPVHVGDLVTIYTDIVREGRTSMGIDVETWVTRSPGEETFKVTQAHFVFVAVDANGTKRPLPDPAA
jgi:acyl-CoA thioesterase YciA